MVVLEHDEPVAVRHPPRATDAGADSALVERLRANDQAAWAECWERHYSLIYRYAQARVFDDAAAAEVATDVFVAAVQSIHRYRQEGSPLLAWLYGIARRKVADHLRAAGRRRSAHTRLEQLERSAGGDPGDGRVAARMDLEGAMERLPEAQREVIRLRFVVGLSTAEIGEVLGKQPGAIYSLQARALLALRKELQK